MRRLLRNFPVNGLSEKILEKIPEKKLQNEQKIEIKNVINAEIVEIKQELEQTKPISISSEMRLLGELLSFLRSRKEMPLLMLCRQINKISIQDGIAVIFSNDDSLNEIAINEHYHEVVLEFFKEKGLGFKIYENIKQESPVDLLNKISGGKLVVK